MKMENDAQHNDGVGEIAHGRMAWSSASKSYTTVTYMYLTTSKKMCVRVKVRVLNKGAYLSVNAAAI